MKITITLKTNGFLVVLVRANVTKEFVFPNRGRLMKFLQEQIKEFA